jgi:hypothetical protein
MALARIITRLSSGFEATEKDLRARGFQVEKRFPGEAGVEPADLEITIEECTAEQALTRAMDGGGDASVFVAPGALPGTAQPLTSIPFTPSSDPVISALQPEIGRTFVMGNPATSESAAELQPAEMIAPQPIWGTDTTIGDLAQNVGTHEDVLAMDNQESVQPDVQPEMISSETEPHHESLEAEPVEQFTDFESADQDVETEPVQEPVFAASDATSSLEIEPVIPVLSEQADIAVASAELHSDGDAAGGSVPTAPSDWPIWQPLTDPAPVQVAQSAMSEVEPTPQVMVQPAELPSTALTYPRSPISYRANLQAYRAALKRFSMDDTLFWKTATLAATVAVAAMLVAVSFHRFSPIPATLENSAAQGAEVQAPAAVVRGKHPAISGSAAVKPVAAESLVQAKPPVLVEASRVPNANAAQKVGLAASKQKIEAKPQLSSYQGDVIAQDTVVRYGATRASLPSPSAPKKSQVKRYSDTN